MASERLNLSRAADFKMKKQDGIWRSCLVHGVNAKCDASGVFVRESLFIGS